MFTYRYVSEKEVGPDAVHAAIKALREELENYSKFSIHRISMSRNHRLASTTVNITFY